MVREGVVWYERWWPLVLWCIDGSGMYKNKKGLQRRIEYDMKCTIYDDSK